MKRSLRRRRRHSPVDVKRIWTIFAIFMLMASMLSAFSNPAVAQPTEAPPEPPVEQPTDVPQEQQAEPPMETLPTEIPTDPPMDQATEAPTEEGPVIQAVEEFGTIIVNYRLCPMGTDLALLAAPALASACTVAGEGTSFNLAGVSADIATLSTGPAPSGVTFANVPANNMNLTQLNPPAAGVAIFCEGLTSYGNTKPYGRMALASGSGIFLEVLAGETITCDWYANEPDAGSTVTVYKWDCLAATMYGEDPGYYGTECATEHLNIPMTLSDNAGDHPMMTQANGTQWDDVVPDAKGRVIITETIPAGYGDPVVFCQTLDDNAPTLMMSQGGVVTLQSTANTPFDYQCFWYNLPSDGGTVTVYKWDCMPGTTYGQQVPDYYPTQCDTEHLNIPITLTDANGSRATTTRANGTQWDDVVPDMVGQITIAEEIPADYGDPVVYCGTLDEDTQTPMQTIDGTVVLMPPSTPFDYQCNWYNVPMQTVPVTIMKWECPQGIEIDPTAQAHASACTTPMNNVEFTLVDSNGPRSQATASGQVSWDDVPMGTISITETVPPGYSTQPYISCFYKAFLTTDLDGLAPQYSVVNNVLNTTMSTSGMALQCNWYNKYMGPGEVTIYKWTCPQGYDYTAWNANPTNDCTEATNGVTFVLDQPADIDLQTDTGDSINGAVSFGGLTPGGYTVTEIVPGGIASVFVLDCVGLNTGSVHPVPLSVGPSLDMHISGGDRIVCQWFNVPGHDPDYGWMTVTKYTCSTATYVSDVDCEVFEGGQQFELQTWNGTSWVTTASGTTNVAGQYTWANLDPGTYRLTEPGKTACLMKSDKISSDGYLSVQADQGTTFKVYNCGVAPIPGGKMPTKYPNTGVEPVGQKTRTPAASLLGALGLLGATSMTRRTLLRRSMLGAAAIGGGTIIANSVASQTIVPLDAEGTPVSTPTMDCLYPATPEATPGGVMPGTPVSCGRGEVPTHIRVEAIKVDANIEILEIIGGAMEQPTGAGDVAWYKETVRLGEPGNAILAGHLNYWGVPEGVFFKLDLLKEGDIVELEGESGDVYRYRVEWTEPFPSDEEPPEDALGQTEDEVITLITCGGEWVVERAEYDHRTLVRAVRDTVEVVEVDGTPAA